MTSDTGTDASIPDGLRRSWRSLADEMGLDADAASRLGGELIGRWSEPHRAYHDLRHLAAVLMALDDLADPSPPSAEARAAAWFHDAIYAGRPGADEEASADLAERNLVHAGLDVRRARRVADMVRATAGHVDPSADGDVDPDTALLLDADLSILAADRDRYDAYVSGVRAEHPGVDDAAFIAGRTAVLRTLLDRDRLYRTARGHQLHDAAARANLRRELSRLGGVGPGAGVDPG